MRFVEVGRSAVPRDKPWLGFPLLRRIFFFYKCATAGDDDISGTILACYVTFRYGYMFIHHAGASSC